MCCKPMTLYILAMLAACCCVLMSCVESSSINATLPSTASASGVISFDSGDSLIYVKSTRQLQIKIDSGRIDTLASTLLNPDTITIVVRESGLYYYRDEPIYFEPDIVATLMSGRSKNFYGYFAVTSEDIVADYYDEEHLSYRYGLGGVWRDGNYHRYYENLLQAVDTVVTVNDAPLTVDRFIKVEEIQWFNPLSGYEPRKTWTFDLTRGKDIVQVQSHYILDSLYQGVFSGEENSWMLINHKKGNSGIIRVD